MLSPREAAEVIGCTSAHVRLLLRSGKMKARKRPSKSNRFGYEYEITQREAERMRDADKIKEGRPRQAQTQ